VKKDAVSNAGVSRAPFAFQRRLQTCREIRIRICTNRQPGPGLLSKQRESTRETLNRRDKRLYTVIDRQTIRACQASFFSDTSA
jgi:hypothetical protein